MRLWRWLNTLLLPDALSAMRSLKGIGATHSVTDAALCCPAAAAVQPPARLVAAEGQCPAIVIIFLQELSTVTIRFFVTGTDTEVGKTVASARCCGRPIARNIKRWHKPVARNAIRPKGLRNEDALALQRNSRVGAAL